ncbi:MAG: heparinase II/III family protein [Sedimentisphaeraceae bacterium JB056]
MSEYKSLLRKLILSFFITSAPFFTNALSANDRVVDTTLSDEEFFSKLDLSNDKLSEVRKAVEAQDNDAAIKALADYFRNRPLKGHWWNKSFEPLDQDTGQQSFDNTFMKLYEKSSPYDQKKWNDDGSYNWLNSGGREQRMYFFSNLGIAWRHSKDQRVVDVFTNLCNSWIAQFPQDKKANPGWTTLSMGIRLRSGWGDSFAAFSKSPQWNDEDMFVFIKSFYEQAHHLRENHSATSNWLTFELAGLYSAGILFPEFKEAADWRNHCIEIAVDDIERGWLPDGVSIELSLGYGQFFSNFLHIADMADETGHADEKTARLSQDCERLFTPYLQIMSPNRYTPAINDNHAVNVPKFLDQAAKRYTDRKDFLWASTNGKEGDAPKYLSVAFPYAGLLGIRSGWEKNDNFLCFVAGPVGYRHAHQDKLSILLNAYGRDIIFDPGANAYSGGNKNELYQQYSYDTFSHSTALVDNRPQRRKWYNNPHPDSMPYEEVPEFQYQISNDRVWARSFYDEHYGKAGSVGNDAYPYKDGGNFKQDWTKPATHERQIFYISPDVFIVQDIFVPTDDTEHSYDVRWQIDSVKTQLENNIFSTTDPKLPNLAIAAVNTDGLETATVTAQSSPEVMGWKVIDADKPEPATTLRHIKKGKGTQEFLTLLLPLKPEQACPKIDSRQVGDRVILRFDSGRIITIAPAAGRNSRLRAISKN